MRCDHKRKKKNYPHGRKSDPIIFCKDCGKIIKKSMKPKQKRRRNYNGIGNKSRKRKMQDISENA